MAIPTRFSTRSALLLPAAFLLTGGPVSLWAERAELPNIVVMMSDDHGWEETGYNGHPYVQTPVLDTMAAEGLRLDRFYAASPVCSPTRASALTGRHANRMGTFAPNWSMRPEEITVAHLLSEKGYRNGHFGKWHVGAVKAESPVNPGAMGFHEWLSHDNFFEMDPPLSRNGGPPEIHRGEGSEVLVREAMRFIDSAVEADTPFFAYICFGSPHEPYSGYEKDLALYDELPAKYADRTSRLTCNETGLTVERPLGEVLRERYAEITAMDRAIGMLRDWLRERRLRDNTIFLYLSDNGTSRDAVLVSPLRGHKGQNYEGGIRVPTVLEWPARLTGGRATQVIGVTSDLMPTFANLVGADLPDRPIDGVDLIPLLSQEGKDRPGPLFFWSYDTRRLRGLDLEPWIDPELQKGTTPLVKLLDGSATRNFRNDHHPEITEADYLGARAAMGPRYKLLIHGRGDGGQRRELFDIIEDPGESNDLSEEKPEMVEALERELREWQDCVLRSLRGADYRP